MISHLGDRLDFTMLGRIAETKVYLGIDNVGRIALDFSHFDLLALADYNAPPFAPIRGESIRISKYTFLPRAPRNDRGERAPAGKSFRSMEKGEFRRSHGCGILIWQDGNFMRRRRMALAIGSGLALCAAVAQSPEIFRSRLAPVAIDAAMKVSVAGSGSVKASLIDLKLSVSGTFEGLRGPATVARIHQGIATGVRGAPILKLSVAKATSGTISGSFELTPAQVENLRKGRWYVQIDSEKAPEGNLWGWLLK